MNPITITQLNRYIKGLIEKDIRLADLLVRGELSNFKLHSSGHCYMTLKDEGSAIRAVMFKGAAAALRFRPENGMKIIAGGRVSVYERDGQYQLYINTMQPDGVGDLHVAFEQLKERLSKEGLFDESRKKAIPRFPAVVGVITSPTGAAVRDIINVATRRYPLAELLICPVQVQGDGAAAQIARAIAYFNETDSADVLIVGRGGGSIEELWAFNEEAAARAIAGSRIPVISAVGHETDFTIADFVSDLRAPTPSAAAELAVPAAAELSAYVAQAGARMRYALAKTIEGKREVLSRFALKTPMDFIDQNRVRTDHAVRLLTNAAAKALEGKSGQLAALSAALNAMSPLEVLSRGYAVAQKDGALLRSVREVSPGDRLTVRVSDGKLLCTAEETEEILHGTK